MIPFKSHKLRSGGAREPMPTALALYAKQAGFWPNEMRVTGTLGQAEPVDEYGRSNGAVACTCPGRGCRRVRCGLRCMRQVDVQPRLPADRRLVGGRRNHGDDLP